MANITRDMAAEILAERLKDVDRSQSILGNAPAPTTPPSTQRPQTIAYTPPKVVVPESKKTSADKMWDRNSQTQKISETTRAKANYNTAKKQYEDYVSSDEYRQRLAENDQKARQQEVVNWFLPPEQRQAPKVIQDDREMYLRAAMEQAEAEYNRAEDAKVVASDLEAITGLSEEDRKELEQYAVNQIRDQNLPVEFQNSPFIKTAEQEAAGLIGRIGKQRADELAETYMRQQNEAFAKDVATKGAQTAGTGFWSGLGSSLLSVPISAVAGTVGTVGQLQGAARSTGRYKTLDPNATGTALQTYAGAIRGQVGQNISGDVYDPAGNLVKDGGLFRGALAMGYQGIMSAADSVARAYIGGSAFGGAALAATNSFSQTMADASARGATPAQAALLATTVAGIEALSEKIPLDNLIRTAKGGKQTLVKAIGTALAQAGIEATTEEISLLGTVLAEAAILQEKSSYQQSITGKILTGTPPEEAKMMAIREILDEAVNTALVSMISGGVSSLSGSAFAAIQERNNQAPKLNTPEAIKQQTLEAAGKQETQQPALAQQTPVQPTVEQASAVAENATADKTEAVAPQPTAPEVQPQAAQTAPVAQETPVQQVQETVEEEIAPIAETLDTETLEEVIETLEEEIAAEEPTAEPDERTEQQRAFLDTLTRLLQQRTAEEQATAQPTQTEQQAEVQPDEDIFTMEETPAETAAETPVEDEKKKKQQAFLNALNQIMQKKGAEAQTAEPAAVETPDAQAAEPVDNRTEQQKAFLDILTQVMQKKGAEAQQTAPAAEVKPETAPVTQTAPEPVDEPAPKQEEAPKENEKVVAAQRKVDDARGRLQEVESQMRAKVDTRKQLDKKETELKKAIKEKTVEKKLPDISDYIPRLQNLQQIYEDGKNLSNPKYFNASYETMMEIENWYKGLKETEYMKRDKDLARALFQMARDPQKFGAQPVSHEMWQKITGEELNRVGADWKIPIGNNKFILIAPGREGKSYSGMYNNVVPYVVDENNKILHWSVGRIETFQEIVKDIKQNTGMTVEEWLALPVTQQALQEYNRQKPIDEAAGRAVEMLRGNHSVTDLIDAVGDLLTQYEANEQAKQTFAQENFQEFSNLQSQRKALQQEVTAAEQELTAAQQQAEEEAQKAQVRQAIADNMKAVGAKKAGIQPANVDTKTEKRYNNRRSDGVQKVIDRLNTGGKDTPTIAEIMAIPEIAEAERANDGLETIKLPNREKIREAGYQKAMQKGSWNGKDYTGEVQKNRRMDIVIGLPGSGKSSVYTERLSNEHKSRVIDTDDFREYIPEYNGSNAGMVHEEASLIRDRIFDSALDNGENILLSTIGANAEKLAKQIAWYKEYGYDVYLHLNELPNNKSLARAIGRYIGEDGNLGRYVSPNLIAEYGDKPTQTYLYLTGQGGNIDGQLGGNLREGRGSTSGDVAETGGAPQSSTAIQADLLAGYDWYNNDVPKGGSPRLIQTSEQFNTSGIKGTGAAEANFSGKAAYQDLLTEENTQRDRPGDVRPMEVPKTDSFGRRVSELVADAYGAEVTTDKMANAIEELVQEGALGFDVRHNQDSMNAAAEQIKQRGVEATKRQITNAVARGKIRDGDIEQAILLYTMYNSKNTPTAIDNASEILVDLATMANITGRNLQMFRMLRQLTPEGQAMTIKKQVQNNIDSMIRSGAVKKGYTTEIDPELMAAYREAAQENMRAVSESQKKASAEKMQTIMDGIYAMEASKMPATMKAKWDAWRYMAMLGNAKTQVRNVFGNVLFVPYKQVKDRTAALAEKLFVPKDQRTKALFTDLELLEWARQDRNTDDIENALKYSGKVGEDVTSQKIRENMRVFDNKALDSVRKFIEEVPAAGDMFFKNGYYARSLADFMKARGYKAADIQNGLVPTEVLNEARSYAVQEAMKATFNDANALSDFLATGIQYKGDNPVGKVWNVALEGALPFRRTPANIAVRFEEYSPLGLINTVWKAVDPLKTGKYTAADVIDSLASSVTGSAAMALGYVLAKGLCGIKLTGSNPTEDEERQGHQEYAIEFADKEGNEYSYKIDWAAPANLPLFVGANIYKTLESRGEDTDVSKFTSFLRGLVNAFEPMLALSCLSGVNDLFESARYAEEGEALYAVASKLATGYFTQGIPALLRQASQASQEVKRTAFSESTDPTIRDIESTLSGIPFYGENFKTDKVNEWGEKISTGTAGERIGNAFFNPGTFKKIDNGALEQEITRLNKAQETAVSPPYFFKVISYTDKDGNYHDKYRLTEEEYQTIAQIQGQTAKRILETMINSSNYKAMSDEEKAKAFTTVYSYAREKAMSEGIQGHKGYSESWMMGLKKGYEADEIIRRVTNSELNRTFTNLDTAWDSGYSKEVTERYSNELAAAYESYSKMDADQKKEVKQFVSGNAAKYIEAREKGISHEVFIKAAKNVNDVKGTDKGGTVRDIDRRKAIAKTSGLTESQIDKLMKVYMPDYDKTDESPETTEFKYQYIREELDLSPREYASTYEAYLDGDKKVGKIADIMALGYDWTTANALYKVYSGSMKNKLLSLYG